MRAPRSWRPFLAYVVDHEPVRRAALENEFSRDLVEIAANCRLVEISESGKWVTITQEGCNVVHACLLKVRRQRAMEQALSLLARLSVALDAADTAGRHVAVRTEAVRLLVDLEIDRVREQEVR